MSDLTTKISPLRSDRLIAINRLEYCPETIINQESSRYHKIEHNPQEIERAFKESLD